MKILGIDASGLAASVAVTDDGSLLGEILTNCKRNHSETLMPMVGELLARLGIQIGEIDYIACTNGPGSFTGLRIGAATAMSLAHGACKKVIPVPTLDVLAYNLYGCAGLIAPMMDARRGQVYTAVYDLSGCPDTVAPLAGYAALALDEALALLAEYDRSAVFLGDGAAAYAARLAGGVIAPPHLSLQRASAVAALGLRRIDDAVPHDGFALCYLRKPQAERQWNANPR